MLKKWIFWRYKRILVKIRSSGLKAMSLLESRQSTNMDIVQSLVYDITLSLINNPNSELSSNSIDYTFHIENDNFLAIIRPQSGHYSINLIEYKTRQSINNFDVYYDADNINLLIDKFEREVQKRMKNKILMKTSKVAKHLRVILKEVENKDI